jgi:hypothetical protein
MSVRDRIEVILVALLDVVGPNGLAVLASALLMTLALLLGFTLRRRTSSRETDGQAQTLLDVDGEPTLEDLTPQPNDRMLPLGRGGFLALVAGLAAGCWLIGFALAGNRASFLASKEWQFQPFYIAAHLATLRLFVALFTRNYRAGIARLTIAADEALAGMHRILGPVGALWALAVALPFCVSDWRYLHSGRYEKLDANAPLQAIDYVMWSIWCTEWFLNAFIWVILAGFLVRNVMTLRQSQFISPIDIVLQDKHYRPFLRMSSQGATVVLVFGVMTALYITYTGGAVTDYLGLGITGILLVVGFLVPWAMLRHKVRVAVEQEQRRLHESLFVGAGNSPGYTEVGRDDIHSLSKRMDYIVAQLRSSQLERLHLKLGATEARAVMIRLLAPAATIGWQLAQNYKPLLEQLNKILQPLLSRGGS